MEKADLARWRLLKRLLTKALTLALIGGITSIGAANARTAIGVVAGVVIAAMYAWGYIGGHLSRAGATKSFFDGVLLRGAFLRFGLLFLASIGLWFRGRDTFVGYLIGFAVAFGFLLITEAGAIAGELKSKGVFFSAKSNVRSDQ